MRGYNVEVFFLKGRGPDIAGKIIPIAYDDLPEEEVPEERLKEMCIREAKEYIWSRGIRWIASDVNLYPL